MLHNLSFCVRLVQTKRVCGKKCGFNFKVASRFMYNTYTHTHKALKLVINDCKLHLCACAKSSSVCQVTAYWPSSQNQVRSSSRPNEIEDLRTNRTVSSQLSQQRTVNEKCPAIGELPLRCLWARSVSWFSGTDCLL